MHTYHRCTLCKKTPCNTLQHTSTPCYTLQHTATHCYTLQHTATHCNTLQQTVTPCNTLQHTATQCNTLQHTATQLILHRDKTTPGCTIYVRKTRSGLRHMFFTFHLFAHDHKQTNHFDFILYTKWCQFHSVYSIIINCPEAWLNTLFTRILLCVRFRCI